MPHRPTPLFALTLALCAAFAAARFAPTPSRAEPDGQTPKKEAAVDLRALFRLHYETRIKSFREQNLAFRNVVLLGDSITEGFEVARYFPGRRVLNRGIGGDVVGNALPPDDARGLLRRLDESVFDCAASDVFLMIGINDLAGGHSPETVEQGYRELLTRIRERTPAVRVHVQSVLPTRGRNARLNGPVLDLNRRLERLAAELKQPYLDLHSLFKDEQGELKAELTQDGLHLTEPGYRIWRREVERRMGWETPQ